MIKRILTYGANIALAPRCVCVLGWQPQVLAARGRGRRRHRPRGAGRGVVKVRVPIIVGVSLGK